MGASRTGRPASGISSSGWRQTKRRNTAAGLPRRHQWIPGPWQILQSTLSDAGHGKELSDGQKIDIFMTKGSSTWRAVHDLSRAQIEGGAVFASSGSGVGNEYICRRQMQDGTHPGKYALGNSNCYISWGGKEYHFTDGFDILFK